MYKVEWIIDQTYQVVCYTCITDMREMYVYDTETGKICEQREIMFQGSLSDCNAWLQLHDKGYL